MSEQSCPRCGAALKTKQVNNVLAKYCDRDGALPYAVDVKTRRGVIVNRACEPVEARS